MFEHLHSALAVLKEAASSCDLSRLSGRDAMALVKICTEAERVVAATRTLAARRVAESKAWQTDGHRSAAEWVASATGTTVGQAIGVLETARRLEELPLTKNAFVSGGLSEVQAREVSDAAWVDPRKERVLLEAARTQTVPVLREECRRVKASAVPDDLARDQAIHRRRHFRAWTDPDGAVRFSALLPPLPGAQVVASVGSVKERIFAEARAAGLREPSEAYAADALVELVSGGRPLGPRAMVHVVIDHEAYVSGRARPDQRCEIPGIGRIPATTARTLAGDAIIKAVVTKGTDVQRVVHLKRTIPAHLRTALEVRDRVCVVPGCGRRHGLEIDHYRIAYADGGPTQMDNLARVCGFHHYLKTHCGYRLGGNPGAWTWETPNDLEAEARPPPGG